MRSRYSAYTLCEDEYVRATWHPSTRPPDLQADPKVQWLGLKIIATEAGGPEDLRGLVEFVAVFFGTGARRGEKIIEFADGAEGMNISGVAVIIFVLDEAGQRFELGEKATEHAQFVHQGERRIDATICFQHGAET